MLTLHRNVKISFGVFLMEKIEFRIYIGGRLFNNKILFFLCNNMYILRSLNFVPSQETALNYRHAKFTIIKRCSWKTPCATVYLMYHKFNRARVKVVADIVVKFQVKWNYKIRIIWKEEFQETGCDNVSCILIRNSRKIIMNEKIHCSTILIRRWLFS